MKIKNIIFDWSGTIMDDFDRVYLSCMEVFKMIGLGKISKKEFKNNFELPYMNFYNKYCKVPKNEIDSLYKKTLIEDINLSLFEDIPELLEQLVLSGINLYIISTHPTLSLMEELKEYSLMKYFKRVYGGVTNKVEIIQNIIKELELDPINSIFIGDMDHDIIAGKKAQLKTIGVTWGYQSEERLIVSNPDYIVSNPNEITEIINNLNYN